MYVNFSCRYKKSRYVSEDAQSQKVVYVMPYYCYPCCLNIVCVSRYYA